MRITFVIALLLSVLLISGTAWALQPGEYSIIGFGNKSCGFWTAAMEKDTREQGILKTWVAGYLTAYSLWVEANHLGPVTNSDTMGAWAWIDNYCRDNPLKEGLPSGGLGEVGSMMPVISYAFLRLRLTPHPAAVA